MTLRLVVAKLVVVRLIVVRLVAVLLSSNTIAHFATAQAAVAPEPSNALSNSLSNAVSAKVTPNGKWIISLEPKLADGYAVQRLTLASENEIDSENGAVRPVLAISCERRKVNVSLNWQLNLGRHSIRMRTDFDGRPHRSEVWSIADDFQTVTTRGSDISFIKRMMRHDRLKVETTPDRGKPVTVEFKVSGLREAIKPLREACRF